MNHKSQIQVLLVKNVISFCNSIVDCIISIFEIFNEIYLKKKLKARKLVSVNKVRKPIAIYIKQFSLKI